MSKGMTNGAVVMGHEISSMEYQRLDNVELIPWQQDRLLTMARHLYLEAERLATKVDAMEHFARESWKDPKESPNE